MASLRDIQNKISAVKKTKQITKAMNMVASAKLRKAQQSIERFRPYADKFYEMLGDMASKVDETAHPLLARRDEIKKVGIIVMTSDRGLCGSFNANQNKAAMRLAEEKEAEGKEVVFYTVGKKARDRVRKTKYESAAEYADQMTSFDFSFANTVATEVIEAYLSGALDEVVMIFGEFISIARQRPHVLPILPIQPAEAGAEEKDTSVGGGTEYIYEPDVEGLLAELLPRFIKVMVYRGMLDTSASEHAARMAAMDNATKACDDMVGNLTLVYNKTRQATITTELMDIVGGAEALKG
ncbi:ATP synthase F1 subunit gamma [Oceanidesulfovibrio indonesiensis]|uniref:ATP synthase gamma chain n=1 Tax=Oceanidesulfovibrio indonesiensis TaxID=54767 RepID=A0A7M3MEZ2_9BACT|nr:F0F1 ATP synthase subunit gamma [Oceanidesulfovibrio indonesiensis]TVM17586.1 ATP synthase F1 subunit gamma [Oceanidesulfovibrio indonesiensis]